MKKKERVIVFDGEDKFIVKKNHTYNAATGEMQRVAPPVNGLAVSDSGMVDLAPPPTPILVPEPKPVPADTVTPEPYKAPDWATMDCEQIQNELASIRNFLSTVKMPPEALAPYQNAIQAGEREFESKCPRNPPALPDVPPTPTPTPLPGVPLVNLGQPPRAGAGGAGGAGEKKPEEKKTSSVLLWVLIAIGAAYLLSDKRN